MQHPLQITKQEILKRKGKFYLLLPIIVVPFLSLLLWSMGIINNTTTANQSVASKGLNLSLPEAKPTDDSN